MREQAGTGLRVMREEWQRLGHPAPTYKNDRAWKAFEFFIPELDAARRPSGSWGRELRDVPPG
jgi:predicted HTH transcriptional regulator